MSEDFSLPADRTAPQTPKQKELRRELEAWLDTDLTLYVKDMVNDGDYAQLRKNILANAEAYAKQVAAGVLVSPWQPIETAPKDGTTILVFKFTPPAWSIIGLAFWYGAHGIHGWISHGIPTPHDVPNNLGLAHPTHWMPLPDPPVGVRAGGVRPNDEEKD